MGDEANRHQPRERGGPDRRILAPVVSAIAGGGRTGLTGLWLAAVSTLVEAGEPDVVMEVLLDRAAGLRGHGRNADSPLLQEDDEARGRRGAEAAAAAQRIVQGLSGLALVDEEDFPERFLDVALYLLAEAWGPVHVRRALWDQRASVEAGSEDVVLPAEPAVSNGNPKARASAPEAPPPCAAQPEAAGLPVASGAPAGPAVPAEPPRRAAGARRRADLHVDAAGIADGRIVYALCARIDGEDVREHREVTGLVRGASLRNAVLRAVARFAGDFQEGEAPSLRIATPVEGAVRCAGGGEADADAAAALAAVRTACRSEWRHVAAGIGNDLARRCDRILRDRLDEAGADAA